MCKDKTIKELLPAYVDQVIDPAEKLNIESHLASCGDCRAEVSLLRMMAEETVPDPGEAFWTAMPDRVYQAVQERETKKKTFGLCWPSGWTALPRWTWAAATVGTVLVISWFIIMPLQKKMEMPQARVDEVADEMLVAGSADFADLDQDDLSTIDSWAGSELASIAQEAEPVLVYGRDVNIYEEIEDLNAKEVERLSKMLEQIRREG
jgi:hypothetical protein